MSFNVFQSYLKEFMEVFHIDRKEAEKLGLFFVY